MPWEKMPVIDRTYANNIRLVIEPVAASNSAAIGFWFPVGSRDEPDGFQGATHFLEHLLFKGTRNRSSRDIALFFDRAGGYINAFTERELVCIMCVVPPECFEESVSIICEMIQYAALNEEDIQTERNVILSEIMAVNDDPEENGMETALALMYRNHPVSRPIAGTIDDVRTIHSETLRSWYTTVFQTAPFLITAAGNISPDSIVDSIQSIQRTSPSDEKKVPDTVPLVTPGIQIRQSPFRQSQLFLSWPIMKTKSQQMWYIWAIINAITGDTVSSRLFQNLREKQGLCYSVYSFYVFNRDSALWCSSLTAPPDKTNQAVHSLVQELDQIVYNGFTAEEIEDAKSHITGVLRLSADDTEYRMKRLARQILFNGSITDIEESIALIRQLRAEAIHEQLHESCRSEHKSLILYGPKKSLKEVMRTWT